MGKMTKKFSEAMHTLVLMGKPQPYNEPGEVAYKILIDAGYQWDGKKQKWIKLASVPGDPASPIIRIRVWAEAYKVEGVASQVCAAMTGKGYRLLEQSIAYPCRPPKQAESRIYLSFIHPNEE